MGWRDFCLRGSREQKGDMEGTCVGEDSEVRGLVVGTRGPIAGVLDGRLERDEDG